MISWPDNVSSARLYFQCKLVICSGRGNYCINGSLPSQLEHALIIVSHLEFHSSPIETLNMETLIQHLKERTYYNYGAALHYFFYYCHYFFLIHIILKLSFLLYAFFSINSVYNTYSQVLGPSRQVSCSDKSCNLCFVNFDWRFDLSGRVDQRNKFTYVLCMV